LLKCGESGIIYETVRLEEALATVAVIIIVPAAIAVISALKSRSMGNAPLPPVKADAPRSFTGSFSGVDYVVDP